MPEHARIDPLDAVRRFQADPPAAGDEAVARAEGRLRAEIAGKPVRRRPRRRRIAIVLVPIVLVAAGAGYALQEPARVDVGPACGDEPTISPESLTVLSPDAGDPVAACAALWRDGVVSGDGRRRASAPQLTACVAPTGAVIVLPGSGPGFCERAGGRDLPAGYAARRERFAALFADLDARFSRGDGRGRNPGFVCVTDFGRARAIVERILAEHGFTDWRVVASDERYGPDRRCATLAYDERARTVTVVPT